MIVYKYEFSILLLVSGGWFVLNYSHIASFYDIVHLRTIIRYTHANLCNTEYWSKTFSVGFGNCSLFCCELLCVRSSFAIILMGKGELVDLLSLSYWCLVIVVWLDVAVPRVCWGISWLCSLTIFLDSFKFSYVGYNQSPTIPTIHNCFRQKSVHLSKKSGKNQESIQSSITPKFAYFFLPLLQMLVGQTPSGPKFDYS